MRLLFAILGLFTISVASLLMLPDPVVAPQTAIPLQVRGQPFKSNNAWEPVAIVGQFSVTQSAIVVCDMWDKHWCMGATRRVEEIARRMDPLLREARRAGLLVIHAPSDTMDFYKGYSQRQLVLAAPLAQPPPGLKIPDPPLPIDDSDGGCDTPGDHEHQAWSRENPLLSLGPQDAISDKGEEIYNLLRQRNIQTLFIMGVHANMCILNRGFAIKQMTNWGLRCILVRDLTDAMYNPARKPFVSHAAGTELVIEHIEKYWCPSTRSADLMAALTSPHHSADPSAGVTRQ